MEAVKVTDGLIANFDNLLYRGKCAECGETLGWYADLDADGTGYSADCCGLIYYMGPQTYGCSVVKMEDY